MPSPFPGMDPYLEAPAIWAGFHRHLIASLYQMLLPGLVDKYRAKIDGRTYTSELALFTSVVREKHVEEVIEVRSRSDGRLVTLVEVVSPANRTTSAGRAAYLGTRTAAVGQKAGVVEIDLITQGTPTLDFPRDTLPVHDYTIAFTRGTAPDKYEVYAVALSKRLPKFKVPLAADDKDTVIDLQVAVTRAFDLGGFAKQIDYKTPMPGDVKLGAESATWAETWLKSQNLR